MFLFLTVGKGSCLARPSARKDKACLSLAQGTAARKAEQLRRMVGEYGQCGELAYLQCPMPLDPSVLLTGIIAEECSVFKSALSPLRLTFRVAGAPAAHALTCRCGWSDRNPCAKNVLDVRLLVLAPAHGLRSLARREAACAAGNGTKQGPQEVPSTDAGSLVQQRSGEVVAPLPAAGVYATCNTGWERHHCSSSMC